MAPINFSNLFKRKHPQSDDITQYYITCPPGQSQSQTHALLSVPVPRPNTPIPIPSASLLFSLTHPALPASSTSAFFLRCLPDPIGFLYHSSYLIHKYLSIQPEQEGIDSGIEWRHQLINLVLKDEPGLAATSGGKIVISLQWVGDIMRSVEKGDKKFEDATKEFKGVLLHELVHTIQYDGQSTTPGWLIESIADYVRLNAKLDPPHWRKSGQGKREKGWEEAYDVGARFLFWLVGDNDNFGITEGVDGVAFDKLSISPTTTTMTTTATATAVSAQATKYPTPPPTGIPSDRQDPFVPPPNRKRPGPYPELVKLINTRLKYDKWSDGWWEEMTGMILEILWKEYLDYYTPPSLRIPSEKA